MKLYTCSTPSRLSGFVILLAAVSLSLSCRKEKPLEISDEDTNFFVIRDNPSDPVDHAMYKFYERTGVASYYTDTIHKKLVSKAGEFPERYAYVTISLTYHPMGENTFKFARLSSREPIPAILDLIEDQVLPGLPSTGSMPSILFIDHFEFFWQYVNTQLADGLTAIRGFKTVGVVVKDVEAMSSTEKRMYAASLLAGIAEKAITSAYKANLESDFFDVTNEAWPGPLSSPLYIGLPLMFMTDPASVPTAESIGVLRYPTVDFSGMILESMHIEDTDLRSFLTALFYYTEQEFTELHADHPLVLKKYGVVKELAQRSGFKMPG